MAFGERVANQHGKAKLNQIAVSAILEKYRGEKGDLVRLAKEFGVGPTCIQKVVSGVTWKHVPGRSYLDRMKQQEQRT